jgi:hypothetical protein
VYCRKVAKNFGQSVFFSAREIEHGRFRALFAGMFWPKILTTKDTKDTKEAEGLPRMDAHERGLKMGSRPVEWKPTPDMY